MTTHNRMNNHPYTRAQIRLNNQEDVLNLVQRISKLDDEYAIENKSGTHRINAKSVIGVMYAMLDFPDEMYLVNETHNGESPAFVDMYRVSGSSGAFIHR